MLESNSPLYQGHQEGEQLEFPTTSDRAEKLRRFLNSRRNLLSALLVMNCTAGAASCTEYSEVRRHSIDLLFTEPSVLEEMPNGDVRFSLSYSNEGSRAIDQSYDIKLRLLDRYLGRDQAVGSWPRVIEGQFLEVNESAKITGIITKEDQENGGRFIQVVLDPANQLPDDYRVNNDYSEFLPGTLIEPQCETQVDENWGTAAQGRPVPDLDQLFETQFPAAIIKWNDTSTSENLIPYQDWPESWKVELREAFEEAWNWFESGTPPLTLSERPKNLFYRYCVSDRCSEVEGSNTYFSVDTVRRMYMQQAAARIAAWVGDWFSWKKYSTREFLNFRHRNGMEYVPSIRTSAVHFFVDSESLNYEDFKGDSEAMVVTKGVFSDMSPIQTLSFLKENQLIGKTAHDTLALVVAWTKRLRHVERNTFSGTEQQNYWGYAGATPLSSVLHGTVNNDPNVVQTSGRLKKHWTDGCHGTRDLLVHLLLPASIYTSQVTDQFGNEFVTRGHAINYFITEKDYTFLSHNDDPYSRSIRSMSMCPEELLNPQSKLQEWFIDPGDSSVSERAIGRRVAELNVERISGNLLKEYCEDLKAGVTPTEGQVFKNYLEKHYTMKDLEEMGLWDRLDEQTVECDRFE